MLNRKILILVPNLDCGGAERVTVTIARLLKKNGASVSFVNLGIERGEMKNWIEPEFSLISLPCCVAAGAAPCGRRSGGCRIGHRRGLRYWGC